MPVENQMFALGGFGIGLGNRQARPAAMRIPIPNASKGSSRLPDFCLSQPAMDGPTKPPRLPQALTKPITAPREPVGSVSLGMAQKGASATEGPGIDRQR